MAELDPTFVEVLEIDALELRTAYAGLQEGVWAAGHLKVTAGAGRTVDVADGIALVQGDSVPDQGLYRIRNDAPKNSDAFEGGGIQAADGANARLDQIVARLWHHEADGSTLRKWRLQVLTGTPTAGATLDNRAGAAALPASTLLLSDLLMPANATSVSASNLRDRRAWARGFYKTGTRATNQTTVAEGNGDLIDAASQGRFECSGVPVEVTFTARGQFNDTNGGTVIVQLVVDANIVRGALELFPSGGSTQERNCSLSFPYTPPAGSRLFELRFRRNSGIGIATLVADSTRPMTWAFREVIRQDASNG